MEIGSVRHKALRAFAKTGNARGLPGNAVDRLRNMLAYLIATEAVEELRIPPNFGAHPLVGDRVGSWALVVNRNWRMTFSLGPAGTIEDLDLEDYH